jgi:MFS family permease
MMKEKQLMAEQARPSTSPAREAGTPQALVLVVANVLPTMGIVALIPIIPQLFAQFHDFPNANFWAPTIITAPSICIALLSPLMGAFADRVGRRKLLLGALFAYAIVGAAPLLLQTLPAIIASRVLLGITEAIIYTNVNTLMGDYFKGETRRKWLAYQNAAGSLLATCLIVAGGVLGTLSWRGPFTLYLLAILIFVAAVKLTWEPTPQDEAEADSHDAHGMQFPWAAMLAVVPVTLISSAVFFIEPLQLGLVLNALGATSPAVIGVVSATTGFALPLGAYLFGRTKVLRVGQLLAVAYLFFACGFWALGASHSLTGVVIGACLAQFACGITFPLLITWCQSKLHFAVRARGMGLWTSTFFIGQFVSTSAVAFLIPRAGGITAVMTWSALFCIVVAPLGWVADIVFGRRGQLATTSPPPSPGAM